MNFMRWVRSGGYVPFHRAQEFRIGRVPTFSFFEGEGGGGGGGAAGDPPPAVPPVDPPVDPPAVPPVPPVPPAGPLSFTQDQVNTLMKKEKEKHRTALTQQLDRVKELEKGKNLSDEQRASLAISKSELEEQLMSEKERSEREKTRLSEEHSQALTKEVGRADKNWALFETTKKDVAISHAASKHGAFNPSQLAAIVGPLAKLVPVTAKAEDGSDEIVDWDVIIKAKVKKDDGTSEDKDLSVAQYVEMLKADPQYTNLFLSERPGGTGFRPGVGPSHAGDPKTMTAKEKVTAGLNSLRR